MTAIRAVWLHCDYSRCDEQFKTDPELGWPPVTVVRRESAKAGWTTVRRGFGWQLDRDYCPSHPNGKEPGEP